MQAPPDDSTIIGQIRKHGWRQGSAICPDSVKHLLKADAQADSGSEIKAWIVLSHDCDIVHHSLAIQPSVELIAMRQVDRPDGTLTHGKNPRRLHLQHSASKANVEFWIGGVTFLTRRSLAELAPDANNDLSAEETETLTNWYALRYIRSAFPDSFNERLGKKSADLKEILKKHGRNLAAVFILLEPEAELAENAHYKVGVTLSMRDEDYNDVGLRKVANEAITKLEAAISKCNGIDVKGVDLRAERDISLAELRRLKRMEFDYLSNHAASAPPSPRPS